MVKIGKCALIALMHKKWTLRVELTKKTSHCKSRDFLRKRRLKKVELKRSKIKKKTVKSPNFSQNQLIATFTIFASETF